MAKAIAISNALELTKALKSVLVTEVNFVTKETTDGIKILPAFNIPVEYHTADGKAVMIDLPIKVGTSIKNRGEINGEFVNSSKVADILSQLAKGEVTAQIKPRESARATESYSFYLRVRNEDSTVKGSFFASIAKDDILAAGEGIQSARSKSIKAIEIDKNLSTDFDF